MYNCLLDNSLWSLCSRRDRRGGFSLVELVVSIGILVLMLSLVGQVFNITIKSTGQAMALTQTSQLLRAFEQSLREDLAGVQPGRSLMLIQGNPVNAYWTQEGKEADDNGDPRDGYPHAGDPSREDANARLVKPRADVLMFFTARQAASAVHPGVSSRLQQVVYGHAQLGEYIPAAVAGGDAYVFSPGLAAFPVDTANNDYPSTTLVSPVSAERWHLARRGVLLVQSAPPPAGPTPLVSALDDPQLLGDQSANIQNFVFTDVVGDFDFEQQVLKPGDTDPWYLPNIFDGGTLPHDRSRLDPTPPPLYANRLAPYFLPKCASFKVEWSLDPRSAFVAGRLAGTKEVYWFDPGRYDPDEPDPPEEHPLAELEAARNAARDALDDATDLQEQQRLERKYLDLRDLLDAPTFHPDENSPQDKYSLAARFLGARLQDRRGQNVANTYAWGELARDGRPNLVVFGAARRRFGTANKIVPEDIFPGALRITIDLFDSKRRLERPIRHVMVIPVGG
jgi:type II secretory pathway pseudopilin PulG